MSLARMARIRAMKEQLSRAIRGSGYLPEKYTVAHMVLPS